VRGILIEGEGFFSFDGGGNLLAPMKRVGEDAPQKTNRCWQRRASVKVKTAGGKNPDTRAQAPGSNGALRKRRIGMALVKYLDIRINGDMTEKMFSRHWGTNYTERSIGQEKNNGRGFGKKYFQVS